MHQSHLIVSFALGQIFDRVQDSLRSISDCNYAIGCHAAAQAFSVIQVIQFEPQKPNEKQIIKARQEDQALVTSEDNLMDLKKIKYLPKFQIFTTQFQRRKISKTRSINSLYSSSNLLKRPPQNHKQPTVNFNSHDHKLIKLPYPKQETDRTIQRMRQALIDEHKGNKITKSKSHNNFTNCTMLPSVAKHHFKEHSNLNPIRKINRVKTLKLKKSQTVFHQKQNQYHNDCIEPIRELLFDIPPHSPKIQQKSKYKKLINSNFNTNYAKEVVDYIPINHHRNFYRYNMPLIPYKIKNIRQMPKKLRL